MLTTTAPLRDRPSDLKREAVARDAVLAVAHDGRHAGTAWYAEWLDGLRRDGTLTRVVRTGLPFEDVIRVLDALPAADEPIPVFADRVLDDTKALTDGPLRGLVLRAVAAWQQAALPVDGEREWALWESVGLVPDNLASQVLVLNVPATGGLLGRWLTEAAQADVPMRVTLHQLRLAPLALACGEVYVCENPAVLRAATTALGPQAPPLICTEGVPSAAVHTLLHAAPGAVIRWRNDFDWTGVRLTAAALQRYPGAVPWRMTAADYLPAADTGTALLGRPTRTPVGGGVGRVDAAYRPSGDGGTAARPAHHRPARGRSRVTTGRRFPLVGCRRSNAAGPRLARQGSRRSPRSARPSHPRSCRLTPTSHARIPDTRRPFGNVGRVR